MAKTDLPEKIKNLPAGPGVYLYKNRAGKIIYVGKAAVLKNRVRQYFQASKNRDPKTELLVAQIKDLDFIETETELDALFLEAELVKRYLPRFNIELRDDKSDLYVRIDSKSRYPFVGYTRRPLDDGAEYFGPYQSGFGVKRALKYLRKIFPYSTHAVLPKRVCLQYHLGLCPGVEEGKISPQDYRQNLSKLKMYLKGQRVQLMKQVEQDMKQAAKAQDFEAAAALRNQLLALKALRRQVVFGDREFMDISKDEGLAQLAKTLGLAQPPKRIEGYDISHMSGTDTVASMVVFSGGLPDKSQYRKFKMRLPGNDDFGHMREAIIRRFSGRHTNWPTPDLMLIDGGKGQLTSALAALGETGQNIPAIGLAKRHETIIVKTVVGFESISLPASSPARKLLQRIRDESHRFALSYHSTLKTNRQSASILNDIPGIGPATRKQMLKQFGSVKGISQARQWELERVIGVKKAALVKQYLSRNRA